MYRRRADNASPVFINDDMAVAFHRAITDSSLGSDEVEEIKTGLRAAFANAAPPAPVVLKDHQVRELVNALRDIAVEYHGTQQLRERIARTVRAAMLQTEPTDDERIMAIEGISVVKLPPEFYSGVGRVVQIEKVMAALAVAGIEYERPQTSPQNIPENIPQWIPCSERIPETDGNYWGWWSESKRQGPVWFIKSELQAQFQSSEITHWMPLPAAPQQEVK